MIRPTDQGSQLALPLGRRPRKSSRVPGPRRSLATVGLFAGIGGLELGMARAGHPTNLLCEIEPGAKAVLAHHFPDASLHEDVTSLDDLPEGTELVTAGFPCQDLSQAGRTKGIEGHNSGLVGHVFRLLEQRRVPFVLLENVPFMLQLSRGRALDVIVTELEKLGYRWAYRTIDSRAFGLPQRRRRVFLLACTDEDPRDVLYAEQSPERQEQGHPIDDGVACGFYWTEGVRGLGWAANAVPTLKGGSTIGIPSPPAIWLPDGRIVKPHLNDAERLQGFRKDWTRPAEQVRRRSHRWKLIGNAVSVPVARWIGRQLARPGKFEPSPHLRKREAEGSWPFAAWNVGTGRFSDEVSPWPRQLKSQPLIDFLKSEPELLSPKATRGFLSRARSGTLRFPPGFLEAVETHLAQVSSG